MDKKEARKILGVTKETSKNDIERKYSILLKKQRMKEKPVDMEDAVADTAKEPGTAGDPGAVQEPHVEREEYSFEQVTQAYNVLMGYEVAVKEEPPSKAAPLLKKAGIDEKKARNFFYYYKFHILAVIVAVIAVISIVRGCVNQPNPDFNIAFIGKISYTDATEKLSKAIKAAVPEIKEPGFDGAYLADDDKSEQQYAMQMKATVLFAAGGMDLYILDKESYLRYAENGAFQNLDEIAPKLGADLEKNKDLIAEIMDTDPTTGKKTPSKDSTGKHLYGIDITNSTALKEAGVIGKDFVAALFVRDAKQDKALKVLQFLMK